MAKSEDTNKELSIDELKAVSGAVKEVDSAKTTPSPWDADNCQNQMAQAKCARKILKKGQVWGENDDNRLSR